MEMRMKKKKKKKKKRVIEFVETEKKKIQTCLSTCSYHNEKENTDLDVDVEWDVHWQKWVYLNQCQILFQMLYVVHECYQD